MRMEIYLRFDRKKLRILRILHERNDFAEGFKILLDTDLKIILLAQIIILFFSK